MMGRLLLSDLLKMRRTWIGVLVVLGPIGVLSITAARYALLYHTIVGPGKDNWHMLSSYINSLLIPTLFLGITILASLFASVEHLGHMWKQLFATPASRIKLYLSKAVWLALLIGCSALLNGLGTAVLGIGLGFGPHLPWGDVLYTSLFPYLASYGLLALQLFLSVVIANQSIAITIGILGVIMSFTSSLFPKWLPWTSPVWSVPSYPNCGMYVMYGIGLGIVLAGVGAYVFSKREVK